MYGLVIALAAAGAAPVPAEVSFQVAPERRQWVESGVNFKYYNRAAGLVWKHTMGDWLDAHGISQGATPIARVHIERANEVKEVRADVTAAVREWVSGARPNLGFMLRVVDGRLATFHSRESERTLRPTLIVATVQGDRTLPAVADITFGPRTHRSHGDRPRLQVSGDRHTLIRFADVDVVTRVERAEIRMWVTDRQRGPVTVGVFHADPGLALLPRPEVMGLALEHPGDRGIDEHPDVLFATAFEQENWRDDWTSGAEGEAAQRLMTASHDPELGFEPLQGKALRVVIPEGGHSGSNLRHQFAQTLGSEPEELYFRYYLRLAESWQPRVQGGKLPGLAGTYGRAGWGGRMSDGFNGWSMRGSFAVAVPAPNPLAGLLPVGTYAYFGDMSGRYGATWHWNRAALGVLERNRWYCIEQHVRLNSPEQHDGVLEVWIDGRKAFQKRDILYRKTPELRIEEIWMNVYHGGTARAAQDLHLYIDSVVAARRYIGPLVR